MAWWEKEGNWGLIDKPPQQREPEPSPQERPPSLPGAGEMVSPQFGLTSGQRSDTLGIPLPSPNWMLPATPPMAPPQYGGYGLPTGLYQNPLRAVAPLDYGALMPTPSATQHYGPYQGYAQPVYSPPTYLPGNGPQSVNPNETAPPSPLLPAQPPMMGAGIPVGGVFGGDIPWYWPRADLSELGKELEVGSAPWYHVGENALHFAYDRFLGMLGQGAGAGGGVALATMTGDPQDILKGAKAGGESAPYLATSTLAATGITPQLEIGPVAAPLAVAQQNLTDLERANYEYMKTTGQPMPQYEQLKAQYQGQAQAGQAVVDQKWNAVIANAKEGDRAAFGKAWERFMRGDNPDDVYGDIQANPIADAALEIVLSMSNLYPLNWPFAAFGKGLKAWKTANITAKETTRMAGATTAEGAIKLADEALEQMAKTGGEAKWWDALNPSKLRERTNPTKAHLLAVGERDTVGMASQTFHDQVLAAAQDPTLMANYKPDSVVGQLTRDLAEGAIKEEELPQAALARTFELANTNPIELETQSGMVGSFTSQAGAQRLALTRKMMAITDKEAARAAATGVDPKPSLILALEGAKNSDEAVAALIDTVDKAAMDVYPKPKPGPLSGVGNVRNATQGALSDLYLGLNPSFGERNFLQDLVTSVVDNGMAVIHNLTKAGDYMKDWYIGALTPSAYRRSFGMSSLAGSKRNLFGYQLASKGEALNSGSIFTTNVMRWYSYLQREGVKNGAINTLRVEKILKSHEIALITQQLNAQKMTKTALDLMGGRLKAIPSEDLLVDLDAATALEVREAFGRGDLKAIERIMNKTKVANTKVQKAAAGVSKVKAVPDKKLLGDQMKTDAPRDFRKIIDDNDAAFNAQWNRNKPRLDAAEAEARVTAREVGDANAADIMAEAEARAGEIKVRMNQDTWEKLEPALQARNAAPENPGLWAIAQKRWNEYFPYREQRWEEGTDELIASWKQAADDIRGGRAPRGPTVEPEPGTPGATAEAPISEEGHPPTGNVNLPGPGQRAEAAGPTAATPPTPPTAEQQEIKAYVQAVGQKAQDAGLIQKAYRESAWDKYMRGVTKEKDPLRPGKMKNKVANPDIIDHVPTTEAEWASVSPRARQHWNDYLEARTANKGKPVGKKFATFYRTAPVKTEIGANEVIISITSAREGRTAIDVRREMTPFKRDLQKTGEANVRYGRGGYAYQDEAKGGRLTPSREPTWVTSSRDNNEARKTAVRYARQHNQESIMFTTKPKPGDPIDEVTRRDVFVLNTKNLDSRTRSKVEDAIVTQGGPGWTIGHAQDGQVQVSVMAVRQFGQSPADLEVAAGRIEKWLQEQGLGPTHYTQAVRVEVVERGQYDALLAKVVEKPAPRAPIKGIDDFMQRWKQVDPDFTDEYAAATRVLLERRAANLDMSVDEYVQSRFYDITTKPVATTANRDLAGVPLASVEFNDGKAVVNMMKADGVGNMVHEVGHVFRRDLSGTDLDIAERWAGAVDHVWTRETEEKFAYGFEKYLATGKAPDPEIQGVFDQFKVWLKDTFDRLQGKVVISDEMQGVYDRLIGQPQTGVQSTAQGEFDRLMGAMQQRTASGPSVLNREYQDPLVKEILDEAPEHYKDDIISVTQEQYQGFLVGAYRKTKVAETGKHWREIPVPPELWIDAGQQYDALQHGLASRGVGPLPKQFNMEPLPSEIFHVTTAKDKVAAEGVKTKWEQAYGKEIEPAGLGGAGAHDISVTTQRHLAESIKDGLQHGARFARRDLTLTDLYDEAMNPGPGVKPFSDEWLKEVHLTPEGLGYLEQGLIPERKMYRVSDLPPGSSHWVKAKDSAQLYPYQVGNEPSYTWWRPKEPTDMMSPEGMRWADFEYWLQEREKAGGFVNPVIVGSGARQRLAQITDDQIAAIRYNPPTGTYGQHIGDKFLDEWKVGTGEALGAPQEFFRRTPDDPVGAFAAATAHTARTKAEALGRLHSDLAAAMRGGGTAKREFDPDQVKAVMQWLKQDVFPATTQNKNLTSKIAGAARDFAQHDYGDKRNADVLLSMAFPYVFWHTRTIPKYALRVAERPGLLNAYLTYRRTMNEINKERPEFYRTSFDLGPMLGAENPIYMNLEQTLFPLYGLVANFEDPQRAATPIGAALQWASNHGASPFTPAIWAYALWRFAQGHKEEAQSWMGYLGSATKALKGATALGARTLGIQSEGATAEPYLWDWNKGKLGQGMDKWDFRRTSNVLTAMQQRGDITPEAAAQAAHDQSGEIWGKATAEVMQGPPGAANWWQGRGAAGVASWLFGQGFKPRSKEDVQMEKAQDEWYGLMDVRATMNPDEWQAKLNQFKVDHPYFETYQIARKDNPDEADGAFAWNVLRRLPPGNGRDPILKEAGMEQKTLDAFYKAKGNLGQMKRTDKEKFMASIQEMADKLKLPSATTAQEWNQAQVEMKAGRAALSAQFGTGVEELAKAYTAMTTQQKKEWREANSTEYARLKPYWDAKGETTPLVEKYYGYQAGTEMFNHEIMGYANVPAGIAQYRPLVEKYAEQYGLPPQLIYAVIAKETPDGANVQNAEGYPAYGPMQVVSNERIAGRPTKEQLMDPDTNIATGTQILADYIAAENGDVKKALYRYSGGAAWDSFAKYETEYWMPLMAKATKMFPELTQTPEWSTVRYDYLDSAFGKDIQKRSEKYFEIVQNQGRVAGKNYLAANPDLISYWDARRTLFEGGGAAPGQQRYGYSKAPEKVNWKGHGGGGGGKKKKKTTYPYYPASGGQKQWYPWGPIKWNWGQMRHD